MAREEGRECYCLTARYGQRHQHELDAARRVAEHLGAAQHLLLDVDLSALGGSALTTDMEVPKGAPPSSGGIPVTYVPARNTILLSLALGWAEVLSAREIWIGVSAVDYSGYPDCRPEFIEAFQSLAAVATRAAVEQEVAIRVRAPLIDLSKVETIRRGRGLGVDYSLTHTCYDPAPNGAGCGHCDACQLRLKAFEELGIEDPVRYR
jgi:7-cyano-7-deazaguanine synthase